MSETVEIVKLEGGQGALVRSTRDSARKPEERSRGSLKELRHLRIDALQVAEKARDEVTKALRTCETYLSYASELLDGASFVLTLAPAGSSESHAAAHFKPYGELRSAAAKYSRLATEKGRQARARLRTAISHEWKARQIAQDIRRRAASQTSEGISTQLSSVPRRESWDHEALHLN